MRKKNVPYAHVVAHRCVHLAIQACERGASCVFERLVPVDFQESALGRPNVVGIAASSIVHGGQRVIRNRFSRDHASNSIVCAERKCGGTISIDDAIVGGYRAKTRAPKAITAHQQRTSTVASSEESARQAHAGEESIASLSQSEVQWWVSIHLGRDGGCRVPEDSHALVVD